MIRPVLALTARSLTEVSGRFLAYLGRTAMLATSLMGVLMFQSTSAWRSAPGLDLFRLTMIVDVVFLTMAAVAYIAPSIAEEKEEGMMALLRMTRLNPLSILLGKGAARAGELGMLVLLQVPLTFLSVTLGGVSLAQVAAGYVSILAYLLFLAGLMTLISTVSPRTSIAATLAIMALLLFHLGAPVARSLLHWRRLRLIIKASPLARLDEIAKTGFSGWPLSYQVITNAVIGGLCFWAAWRLFDRFTREQKPPAPPRVLFSHRGRRSSFNPGPVWRRAVLWKDYNFMAGGTPILALKFLVYALLVWPVAPVFMGKSLYPMELLTDRDYPGSMAGLMAVILMVELLYCVSQVFREEIRWGTLSTLMLLPKSSRSVALQKLGGIFAGAVPALVIWAPFAWGVFLNDDQGARLGFMYMATQAFVVLAAILLLSLYLKRGSVLLVLALFSSGWFVRVIGMRMLWRGLRYMDINRSRLYEGAMFLDALLMCVLGVTFVIWSLWRVRAAAAAE